MTKVKICGLSRAADIEAVNDAMPDYIGFVFAPNSRRQISPELAANLKSQLHPDIIAVGVFVDAPIAQIKALVQSGTIGAVQLHGTEDIQYLRRLAAEVNTPILKALAVTQKGDAQKWDQSPASHLLLDNAAGGTGQRFDWNLIGKLNKPYFLAGGLDAQNVTDAIKRVSPFAVDVSSGVETNGVKDHEKIRSFIRRVRNG